MPINAVIHPYVIDIFFLFAINSHDAVAASDVVALAVARHSRSFVIVVSIWAASFAQVVNDIYIFFWSLLW